MRFLWDPVKAVSNYKKHGVSFELASSIFDDPNQISIEEIDSQSEQRWITIGMTPNFQTLIVVHLYFETISGEEVIRIISARKANKREKKEYEEGI